MLLLCKLKLGCCYQNCEEVTSKQHELMNSVYLQIMKDCTFSAVGHFNNKRLSLQKADSSKYKINLFSAYNYKN